jgi:hypothetical protein
LANVDSAEINRNGNLSPDRKAGSTKRHADAVAINGLEKTMADFVVNVVVHTYDLLGQLRVQKL